MKHTITTILIQATIAVSAVFSSYAAQASGCSLRNDSMVDTRDLGEFVKAEMNPIKKVSLNAAVPSERYFRIDRNSSDYPELQMLNTDGILTSTEDVNVGLLKSGQRGYAQVVPFTKCHWFSNIHVVNGIALERQEQLKIGTEVYGSFGQGNSCEGKESFKVAGVKAQLAGYNPNSYNEKTGEFFNDMDWAVLKQNAAVKGLPVARICENSFSVQDIGIATGTPVDQIDDRGFSVHGAEIVQGESATGTGIIRLTNKKKQLGKSGGPIYKIDKDGFCLAAITVGSGKVLKISTIMAQIAQTNPALVKDIMRVMRGGECKP